jgi:hypothetical protein
MRPVEMFGIGWKGRRARRLALRYKVRRPDDTRPGAIFRVQSQFERER